MTEFDKDAVRAFLKEFKRLMSVCRLRVSNREVNNRGLIALGLTYKQRINEIKALNVLNYSSGPDPDHNFSGNYWVFGKMIYDHEVYIKLKIVDGDETSWPLCKSFHPADEPLDYPFVDNDDE